MGLYPVAPGAAAASSVIKAIAILPTATPSSIAISLQLSAGNGWAIRRRNAEIAFIQELRGYQHPALSFVPFLH